MTARPQLQAGDTTTGRLAGTIAVVTGASSGIGEATAQALAGEGATVAVFARRRERLDALVGDIEAVGGVALSREVDVTDPDAVAAAVREVGDRFGRIDVLVNNAGYIANGPAREADLADWQRTMDVNVGGVLNTTHAALPYAIEAASGERGVADIVMVSSVAGRRVPTFASNVYAASKHAVGAFADALRQELVKDNVRVSLIEPGVVRTEMTTGGGMRAPDARAGNPLLATDVARSIVFMVTQPARVSISEVLIRPTEQTL